MKFLKKIAFNYVAPILSICSVATTQLEAQCDPSPCAIDWCSLLVPALVGAAAGAATGAAVNSRGKHGKQGERGHQGEQGHQGSPGERGPEGDNPFIRNYDHSLAFQFVINSISFVTPPGIPGNLSPYVTSPNGHIVDAASILFADSSTQTTSVTIASPVFGDYVFGLEFPAHTSDVTISYTLNVIPDNRAETTYSGTTLIPANTNHFQLPFNFTYGPIGTIPSI